MMAVASAEHRPLKRQKLGPPDVYPQDANQREDELDEVSVRNGFTHRPQIKDEYGSAISAAIISSKIANNFNAILKKKAELNQLPDTGRKKQQINIKDNFWHATPRSKGNIETWFKDLAGSKPLTSLAKKVPIFPKREDMLLTLCEYSVPMSRAAWFIKMTSFYHESKMAESKVKRRPQIDLSQDWTQTLTRCLREHLSKISEVYLGPAFSGGSTFGGVSSASIVGGGILGSTSTSGSSGSQSAPHCSPHHGSSSVPMGSSGVSSPAQLSEYLRHWNYCAHLAFFMYQEGLLDRQEFLDWVVDTVVRLRQPEHDSLLRVVFPLILQYLDEITQCEFLSRKVSNFSAIKIKQLCSEFSISTPPNSEGGRPMSPAPNSLMSSSAITTTVPIVASQTTLSTSSAGAPSASPAVITSHGSTQQGGATPLQELLACHQHRPILLSLSCFLQAVTLDCPTAMVWNKGYEGRTPPWLVGSPLDHLPCAPSDLPMPPRQNNQQVRTQLRIIEEHICQRSQAAENRWSLDKSSVDISGTTITRVLGALEGLDTHCFTRVDQNNSLDTLYSKIFASNKDSLSEVISGTNQMSSVNLSNLSPNHYAQSNLSSPNATHASSTCKGNQTGNNEDAIVRTLCEWAVSAQRSGEHRALVVARLLEKRQNDLAPSDVDPTEEKDPTSTQTTAIANSYIFQDLLLKFLDNQAPVYDENALSVRSQEFGNLVLLFSELIRQDVFSHDSYMCTLISRGDLACAVPSLRHSDSLSDQKEDGVDNIDDDIDKILQNIAKEADAPDSPKDDVNTSLEDQAGGGRGERGPGGKLRPPRHLIYAQHFPLPLDDAYNHEINQRYVLLYGVGKARDEARHLVKKLYKEILKLFSKKFSIDITEGGKVKRSSRAEINFEAILSRFRSLSYFDQNVITNQVAVQVLEMLSGVGSGSSNYLPVLDHISFLMDLMEISLNIQGLLDLCTQMIKEVVDIESQLVERQCLVGTFCPQLTLHVVGFLRKYHCCLLVSQEQTTAVFEGLCRLVKHVTNPSDCTSPERVVLAHLYDLYMSCSFLKSKHHESFSNANQKIKQTLYPGISSMKGNYRWNSQFMEEYIKNPKLKIDPIVVKQLNEPSNRYSFVWSALIEACSASSNEKLNDIAILCAELTACCNSLSTEWLHALNTLCCSSENSSGYNDVLSQIDLTDSRSSPAIHASLSVFTAILIARHCFTLPNFLSHVVFQSLKAAWNNGNGNPEAEPGARLTCHLLLRIFKGVDAPQPSQYGAGSPQSVSTGIAQRSVRMNCDRNLLAAAAHLSLTMAPVLTVLKAMLIVSDAMSGQSKSQASISDILGTSDVGNGSNDSDMLGKGADKACLADFARYALRQICSQEWVRECCLKYPKELCSKDKLLDSMLSPKQALRLLHLICHPDSPSSHNDAALDHHSILSNILEDLDEWTLRISWLDLKLMYEQHRGMPSSQQELNNWLDNVAQAVIGVFQQNVESEISIHKQKSKKSRSVSLVAPLISKLPKAVQGRVLKTAGEFLNSVNFGAFGTKPTGQQQPQSRGSGGVTNSSLQQHQQQQQHQQLVINTKQWPLTSHRPFLQLVLMCLEGQEDQLTGLLDSLKEQLNQAVNLYKEDKTRAMEDSQGRQQVLGALKLRFALVGSLFDTIVSASVSLICEWTQLFVNLIIHGVIDLTNNSELFTNILDMLAALIHSTLTLETNSENREENRRNYFMVVKKVKKELIDHRNVSLRLVRQLTPFPKVHTEVITLDPWGTITDTKGNRIQDFEKDKKHGLQVAEKQKLSPWDLLDGHKNPAPLSWVWFAATRLERKPLKYEEAHRLQRFHTHNMMKSLSYYLEPPPLPPEDLEPVMDKQLSLGDLPLKEEVKAPDTPSSDQSPRGNTKRGSKSQRARRATRPRQPSVPPMANTAMQPMTYQSPNYGGNPQTQWPGTFASQHQQPQTQPQQATYCSQQLPPAAGGPRFAASPSGRVAIRQYLVHRQPTAMMGQPNQANFPPNMSTMPMSRSGPMIRTSLRASLQPGPHPGGMYGGAGGMQGPIPPQGMPSQPAQMYNPGMGGQGGQGGMGQYTSYQQASMSGGQMISQGPGAAVPGGAGGPGLIGQGYQQGYQNPSAMMNMRQTQQSYMGQTMQGPMVQRSQYMQGPGSNANLGMMNSGQPYSSRAGMVQGGGAPSAIMVQGGGAPSAIMRQRMMIGSGGTGQPGGPAQGGSMMTHMQRPMAGSQVQNQQQQQAQAPGPQQQGQNAQQQMMQTPSQGMGYPQPPPY